MKSYFIGILLAFLLYCLGAYHWTKHYGPIIIYSETLFKSISSLTGLPAKAIALPPPFVALKYKNHNMNATWIRHEQIHHLQYTETFFLIAGRSKLEYLYAKHILKKDTMSAYLRKATEQEAYLNQENPTYIFMRKARSSLHYIKHKNNFTLEEYKVILQ